MITFFGIFFILVSLNAVLIVFSLPKNESKARASLDTRVEENTSKVYPLLTDKYKKAI